LDGLKGLKSSIERSVGQTFSTRPPSGGDGRSNASLLKENSKLPPRANQKFSFQGCGVQPKKKKRPLEYSGPKARIFIENEEEARMEADEKSKHSREMLDEIV
jgi:hypothetical protein